MINPKIIYILFVNLGLLKFNTKKRYLYLYESLEKAKNPAASKFIFQDNKDYLLFLEIIKKYFSNVRQNNIQDYIDILKEDFYQIYSDINQIRDKNNNKIVDFYILDKYLKNNKELEFKLDSYSDFEFKNIEKKIFDYKFEDKKDLFCKFQFTFKGEKVKFNNFHFELLNTTKEVFLKNDSLLINSYLPIQDSIILVLYQTLFYLKAHTLNRKRILILTSNTDELANTLNNISTTKFKDSHNIDFHKRFSVIKSKKFKYHPNYLLHNEVKKNNPEDISDILISKINPLEFEEYTLKNINTIIIAPSFFEKFFLNDFINILEILKKYNIRIFLLTDKLSIKTISLIERKILKYMIWSQHELRNLYDNSNNIIKSYFEIVQIEGNNYKQILDEYENVFKSIISNQNTKRIIDYDSFMKVKNFYILLKRKKLVFNKNYSSEINYYSETGLVNSLKDKYSNLDYIIDELFRLDYKNSNFINNKLKFLLDSIHKNEKILILLHNKEEIDNLKNYLKNENILNSNLIFAYNINKINLNDVEKIIVPGSLSKDQLPIMLDSNFKKIQFLVYNFEKNQFYNNLKRKIDYLDKLFQNRYLKNEYCFSKFNLLEENFKEFIELDIDFIDSEKEIETIIDKNKENKFYFKDKPENLLLTFEDHTTKETNQKKRFYILTSENETFDIISKHAIEIKIGDNIYFPKYEFNNKVELLERYILKNTKFNSLIIKFKEHREQLKLFLVASKKSYSIIAEEISKNKNYQNISKQTIKDFFEINILCPESFEKLKLICKSINFLVGDDIYLQMYKNFKLIRNKSFELNKRLHELCVKKYLNELSENNKYELSSDLDLDKLVAENIVKEVIGIKNG